MSKGTAEAPALVLQQWVTQVSSVAVSDCALSVPKENV